ncbi:unnamed protein product [Microthlaspi erraticum]|uniref:Uncharacterized protein n=1 Tax=Microthlaspi erraticum TaxID=1685480 RepID=A0A6D2IVU6_9BRAS|nr:unnamed protein product [Microthlaspi erraticum]
MDFIKTSSLRALIELTFQRNWNGLIWMSRKGVIAKRVKAAPDGHIENQRRTRRPAGRGTNVPRSAKTVSVRLKSRPKSKTVGRSQSRPGKHCPRSAKPRHAAHDHRASRETPRGRATHLTYHAERAIRPGKRPASGRETIGQIHRRPHRPTASSGPTVPTRPKTRLSGRPSRPTVRTPRSTRSRF